MNPTKMLNLVKKLQAMGARDIDYKDEESSLHVTLSGIPVKDKMSAKAVELKSVARELRELQDIIGAPKPLEE